MKKFSFTIILLVLFTNIYSQQNQNFPEELYGIWEGNDRFVFFENNEETGKVEAVVILKEFYGWYFDRAEESDYYSNKKKRIRNDATAKKAEYMEIGIQDISRSEQEDNAWELILKYTKRDINYVPICIIDNKMYLDFLVKNISYDESGSPIITSQGLWRGNVKSEGIKICPQREMENIPGYLVTGDKVFDIRYWKSSMDFTPIEASFNYKDNEYDVFKHLISAGNVYACTTGRSVKVRNIVPPKQFSESDYIFNDNKTVMVRDKQPYLVKLADKSTFDDLMKIVKTQNRKRKPPRPPLFNDENLDFHWDLIFELERNNKYVQEVRKREREFVELYRKYQKEAEALENEE